MKSSLGHFDVIQHLKPFSMDSSSKTKGEDYKMETLH